MPDWKWMRRRWSLRNKWDQIIFFVSMIVLWYLVSVGRWSVENQGEFYILKMAMITKIGLVATVYLGRELLFQEARIRGLWKFLFLFWAFIIIGAQAGQLIGCSNWFYLATILLDTIIWSLFLAMISESIIAVFRLWLRLPLLKSGEIHTYWRQLRMDLGKLGLLLTVLMVFGYIYGVNFFFVDMILYSYLLLIPLFGGGTALFSVFRVNLANWFENELEKIDSEIGSYLDLEAYKPENENTERLPKAAIWLEYLYGVRHYLERLQRLKMAWWLLASYLGYALVILSLPYLMNVVIEV